jgi:Mn-dependent DtxR family transcriptional regulator
MTRLERVADLLLQHGPSTTREIAARMGIANMATASAMMSHAQAYGYAVVVSKQGMRPSNQGPRLHIYGPSPKFIRRPTQ